MFPNYEDFLRNLRSCSVFDLSLNLSPRGSIRPARSVVIMLTFGSEHNFGPTAPLAQLAEQLTLNQWVPGSSPGGCTNTKATSRQVVFLFGKQQTTIRDN